MKREFTPEEIAKSLRRSVYGGEDEGVELIAADMLEEQAKRIGELEAELAKLREENRWIPVEERLPEEDGRYLCVVKSFAFPGATYQAILYCDRHGFREGNIYTDDVTHWKPLPKGPEVGHE